MSLRAKLLLLWGGLAVAPILAIGAFEYFHSVRTLRTLIASQVGVIAERVAGELADRHARRVSDLLLVAENAETQRLYRAYASGASDRIEEARSAAEAYLSQAWELFSPSYHWIELRDSADIRLLQLGLDRALSRPAQTGVQGETDARILVQPVLEPDQSESLGNVVALVSLDALLPRQTLETTFGRAGYSTVIDRGSDRILYHPRHAFQGGTASALLGPTGWDVDPGLFQEERGSFVYREADSTRIASFISLPTPPWTIIASGTLDEFAPSVAGMRVVGLFLVLLVALVASGVFVLAIRRGTRSLIALTSAADDVGSGNFAPSLPEAGDDEVGRLTVAFEIMVGRIEEMVRQIEASRHMAVVGEFASQVSHEIRNPLTSLKLNLQTLQRAARGGRIPREQAPALDTCLQEIQRLDRVVKGVLTLGRRTAPNRVPGSMHVVLEAALQVVRPQAAERAIRIDTQLRAREDQVLGDAEQLEAAVLNLLLNSLDAVGEGGRVLLTTENRRTEDGAATAISVQVADDGAGVPPGNREDIFRPFFSSKPEGSGFGLPLALRTAEEHGGRLVLEDGPGPLGGAAFTLELPLLASEADE
jgi:signal transduction histidine kinase